MEQIQQVLYNLLDNAIKFSNDNSSVQIETTVKSGKVFVSVKDYGTGIPKESLGKIWDRFYKIDASRGKDRKGTGLGLSIVKEIINAHNQNLDVISTEGCLLYTSTIPQERIPLVGFSACHYLSPTVTL